MSQVDEAAKGKGKDWGATPEEFADALSDYNDNWEEIEASKFKHERGVQPLDLPDDEPEAAGKEPAAAPPKNEEAAPAKPEAEPSSQA